MAKKTLSRGGLLFAGAVAVGILAYALFANQVTGDGASGRPMEAVPAVASGPVATPVGMHGADGHHPAPRPAAEREAVVGPVRYAEYPRIANAYRAAREIPETLDGIFCYCNCADHAGHYSLLSCFASDHAAMCDVCMSQAEQAFRLSQDGVDLDTIRDVIDRTYGG